MIIEKIKALEDGIEFLKTQFSSKENKEKVERMIGELEEEVRELKEYYDFNIDDVREKTNWYFVHLFAKEWEIIKKENETCHIEFEENEKLFTVYIATEEQLIVWEYYILSEARVRFVHNTKKIADICKKVL